VTQLHRDRAQNFIESGLLHPATYEVTMAPLPSHTYQRLDHGCLYGRSAPED
jgi:hypothetical protein